MTNNKNTEPWMQELWNLADKFQISDDVIPRDAVGLEQLNELKLEDLDAEAFELIKLISKLPNLKTLDLSFYGGEYLPDEIVELTSLEQLTISESPLERLPNRIHELKNLQVLNLCYTGIKSLPESISRLENLKSIDLSACDELQGFPDGFFQLTQLEELLLYSTELYSDEIGSLKKLKKLSLSGDLYEIPVWIFDLKELTELCLNEVALSEIPSEIGELTKLEYLDLGVNERITKLPESFGNLTNLKHLSLICCSLQSLPESFVNLTQLEKLELGPSDMNTLDRLSHGVTEFLTQLGDTVSGWEKKEPAEPWMQELWDWADKSKISEYDIPRDVEFLQNPYAITLDNLTAKKLSEFCNKFAQLKNLDFLHINLKGSLSNIPNGIGNFSNLKSLTIRGFGLTSLPKTIGNLENLTSLDISFSELTSLPETIGNLENLTDLNISGNQLTSLPETITNLKNLTDLNIGGNQLTPLPEAIGNLENLTSLTSLDISFSELTSLPETIGNLENLTDLNISHNQLTSLPETIGNLENLTDLNISDNQLTSLPETIGNLENLTDLNISGNQLTSLPESIGNLKKLTRLETWNNQLTSLPETITNLKNLTDLNISHNQLTSLPETIGNLENLTDLNISDNQLTSLPETIGNLENLTDLNISGNQLTSLPESIGNLKKLTRLKTWNNQLTSLPESIGNLENLTSLDISDNQLTSLPETIGNLENLTGLIISDNQLTSLPESIINLTELFYISLSGNELNNYSDKVKDFLIQLINNNALDDWQPQDFVKEQPTDNIIESYIHSVPNEVKETVNLDDFDLSELEQEIIDRLDQIIVNNIAHFREQGDFKVRPGYGYDKFYLDWVDGSYDMSLQSLIHYIMYEDGIYKKVLNKNQYARLLHIVNEQPESIFSADELIDENYSQLQYDFLDYFYYTSIKFVYDKLTSLDFDVSDAFSEYLGIDPY